MVEKTCESMPLISGVAAGLHKHLTILVQDNHLTDVTVNLFTGLFLLSAYCYSFCYTNGIIILLQASGCVLMVLLELSFITRVLTSKTGLGMMT